MIKLLDILQNKTLVPRRSKEERQKKNIKQLFKSGSLDLNNTPLSKKYTKQQIKDMVPGVKSIL